MKPKEVQVNICSATVENIKCDENEEHNMDISTDDSEHNISKDSVGEFAISECSEENEVRNDDTESCTTRVINNKTKITRT